MEAAVLAPPTAPLAAEDWTVEPHIDVGFAEYGEEVAGAGLLQVVAHHEVVVHPNEQYWKAAQGPFGLDVAEAVVAGHDPIGVSTIAPVRFDTAMSVAPRMRACAPVAWLNRSWR